MKRAEIFKELKKRNAYKKEYFKMKVPELMSVLEKLNGISIAEPNFEDEDEESEPEPEQNQQLDIQESKNQVQPVRVVQEPIVSEKPKKIKKEKVAVKKVIEPPVVLEKPKNTNYRKDINIIIKTFEEDLYDLLKHFDDGELTQNDVNMILSEFDVLYDEVSDTIEKIFDTNDVSDSNYIGLIQRKLNSNTIKVQRFLETE